MERGSAGSKRADEDQLEAGFYDKCHACHCCPDRTVSRQSSADALVELFDDHCPFVGLTLGEPRRDHRVLDSFPMATLTLRTLLSLTWMTHPLWVEKTARHSRPALWHTNQVRDLCKDSSLNECLQSAVSVGLFQQGYIGTGARVFQDTSPQWIMKCDAGTHEETFTFVVLSGDTTIFPSFGECVPNELTVSALYTMQFDVICPQERKFSVWVWALRCMSISFLVAQASAGALFSGYLGDGRTSEPCHHCSHGGRGCGPVFTPRVFQRSKVMSRSTLEA